VVEIITFLVLGQKWTFFKGLIIAGKPENQYKLEVIAKVVIPVQTGIQKFLQHIEKTGFPLSWE